MRVLLDENVPVELAPLITDHEVHTVVGQGRSGVTNGELLQRAAREGFEALVTMDRSLGHQQNVAQLPFGVVVLRTRSKRMAYLSALVPSLLAALRRIRPGQVREADP